MTQRERYNLISTTKNEKNISARERYNALVGKEKKEQEPIIVSYRDNADNDVNKDGSVDVRDLVRERKNQQAQANLDALKQISQGVVDRFAPLTTPATAGKTVANQKQEKEKLLTTIPSVAYDEEYTKQKQNLPALKNMVDILGGNLEKDKKTYKESPKLNNVMKTLNAVAGLSGESYEQSESKNKYKQTQKDYYSALDKYLTYSDEEIEKPKFSKDFAFKLNNDIVDSVVSWLANGRKNQLNVSDGGKYKQINNAEEKTIYYLYNKKGKDAVEDYLEYISPELNKRLTTKNVTKAQELAKNNPALASLISHATSTAKGAAVGNAISSLYKGEDIDVYGGDYQLSHITNAIRGQIQNDIVESTKNTPVLKQLNKVTSFVGVDNIPAFIYSSATSAIDSAINFALAKGMASGLSGLSGEALNKVISEATSLLMGSQVAQDSIIDAKEKGLSDSEAITLGIIRGSIEGITEKYSIDSILDNPDSLLGKVIKSPYKRAFVAEGSEEVSSNWLNRIADGLYYADESDLKNKYNQYIANGNSKEDALALVVYDIFKEDASSFIAGGLSGMSINVTNNILSNIKGANPNKIGKSVVRNGMENEVINTVLSLGEQSDAYQIAKAVTESGEMSTEEIGKIALFTIQELNQQKADTIKNIVYNRVVALGGDTFEADSLSTYFSNFFSGIKSSKELASTVEHSRFTEEILKNDEFVGELKESIKDITERQNTLYSATSRQSTTAPKTLEGVEESKEKAIGFTEPTNKEIYREPTTEEMSEAMFGKRKNAKQRHILDVAKKLDKDLKVVYAPRSSNILNGKNGKYNPDTKTMYLAEDLTTVEGYAEVFKHEFVHRLELRKAYDSFKKYLFNKSEAFELYAKSRLYILDGEKVVERTREEAISALIDMYVTNFKGDEKIPKNIRDNFTREKAEREAVADFVARVLFKGNTSDLRQALNDSQLREFKEMETDLSLFEQMAKDDRSLLKKIIDVIKDFIRNIKGVPQFKTLEQDLKYIEERLTRVYNSADNKKTATDNGGRQGELMQFHTAEDMSFSSDDITKIQRQQKDIIQSIGEKNINNLSKEELEALRPIAKQYWDEMKEKSPLFRAWFGDWRFYDKTKIKIANILGNKRGLVKNKDTSWDINVSSQVFNENNIHKNKISREAKPYMPYIQDIIKKAVLLDSWGVGNLKSENSLLMHSLYAIADIGNGPELLKLYVEEMFDPNNPKTLKRAYKLNNIESQQLSVVGSHNSVSPITSTAGVKTIADLFALVKQKDKNFNPKPSSAIVEENGNPLIVYHGTDEKFTEFDTSHQRTSGKLNFGKGIYLTPNRSLAEMYSNTGNVMKLFAVVKNPYEIFSTRFDNSDLQKLSNKFGEEVTLDNVDKILQKNGYDGIIARTYNGTTNPINQIIVFKNTQVKSATDNIGTFDSKNANINYSSDDIPTQTRNLIDSYTNGEISQEEFLNQANKLWVESNEKFGSLPQGENAKNSIQVPEAVAKDKPTERFIRTIIETDTLKENALKNISEKVLLGDFSYEVISDDSAIKKADNSIKNGTADSIWENTVEHSARIGKNQIAIGEKLLTKAIKENDVFAIMKLSSELSDVLTRAGQIVQAARLLKKMSGPGRLVALQRTVKTLNNDLQKKYGIDRTPIRISEETAQRIVNAKTPNGLEYAYQEALREIADQVPATWLDKWNAWRYYAMLANPKTHIKNFSGNGIFLPAVMIKSATASIMELAIDESQRTKTLVVKKEYLDYAKKDSKRDDVKALLKGNKYSDKSEIREKQQIFKSEALEFLTQFNNNALEFEDMIFKNVHYISALAGFLQARKVNLNNVSEQVLSEARTYAIKEAKKATFNDESALANMLQNATNHSLIVDVALGSVLPFKRTPINVIKRGIEYSPIGLTKSLTKGLYDVKKGKITPAEFIDGIAAGTTGTFIMVVGLFLASLGCVTGGKDDDELSTFEKWLGKQEYSVEILGKSYTIDWSAPSSIPFFIGVELFNTMKDDDEFQLSKLGNVAWNTLEPITNLSMLSGMQNVIESTKYAKSNQILSTIVGDSLTSYVMQGLPSTFGAISRTIDPKERMWYTDKNSKTFDSFSQGVINNVKSKIPGLSFTQAPKIDPWGRTVTRGGVGERILENFISPGYYSEIEYSDVDKELKNLFISTDESVLPKTANESFPVNGETKYLTADEYVTYAKAKGEYSFDYINEFINSSKYKKLSDEEKAEVIKNLYKFADAKAKTTVSDYDLLAKGSNYKTVTLWERNGKSVIDYYIFKAITK